MIIDPCRQSVHPISSYRKERDKSSSERNLRVDSPSTNRRSGAMYDVRLAYSHLYLYVLRVIPCLFVQFPAPPRSRLRAVSICPSARHCSCTTVSLRLSTSQSVSLSVCHSPYGSEFFFFYRNKLEMARHLKILVNIKWM